MTIEELRCEIDEIDDKLLELFERRMAAVKEIGQYKKEKMLPVKDAQREMVVLSRLCEKAQPQLSQYVSELFQLLFEMSGNYQNKL